MSQDMTFILTFWKKSSMNILRDNICYEDKSFQGFYRFIFNDLKYFHARRTHKRMLSTHLPSFVPPDAHPNVNSI